MCLTPKDERDSATACDGMARPKPSRKRKVWASGDDDSHLAQSVAAVPKAREPGALELLMLMRRVSVLVQEDKRCSAEGHLSGQSRPTPLFLLCSSESAFSNILDVILSREMELQHRTPCAPRPLQDRPTLQCAAAKPR